MPPDKFTAVWTSHTSISDFLDCPRAYYLKHVYKDPKTRHKVKLMGPALALGQSVHEVLESLSVLPTPKRLLEPLLMRFERAWSKVAGKRGGFYDTETEYRYKERGKAMLRRVEANPGPIERQAIKIQQDLPYFWLSEEDNIILCGKIDWLEYLPEIDSVHIIDFKTGKAEENPESLQLQIYHLLVHQCQKRKVAKASYWYLETNDDLTQKSLPDVETAREKVLDIARQMKLARQLERFKCPRGEEGCWSCRPLESVLRGEAEFVGEDEYRYDVYVLKDKAAVSAQEEMGSIIL